MTTCNFKTWLTEERVQNNVTRAQLKAIEKYGDRLLKEFDIDIEFTRHFADRMNDERNTPKISPTELTDLFQKIAQRKGARIRQRRDGEAVLHDLQKDLNIPVVIKYDAKNDEFDVVYKTVMRKKGFRSNDPFIRYQ